MPTMKPWYWPQSPKWPPYGTYTLPASIARAPRWFWSRATKLGLAPPIASITSTGQPGRGMPSLSDNAKTRWRARGALHGGIEIDGLGSLIYDRRAGYSQRGDVATGQRRAGHRFAERAAPKLPAACRIDRHNHIVFGRNDQYSRIRSRRAPIQRLAVDVAGHLRAKTLVQAQRARPVKGEGGDQEVAAAGGVPVITEN